ncbi:Piwi domain-containing protein [Cellulophaga lytica]|uniref:Protein argonaute n=1 Tax=Cellulophaga lytica (strain ATCC 23178 / DSM 7489 / JCM 8516 / NBRC 14961 / NCIMB 1423 / VKM B-1433 / Cy l20) TaxID=867900 RepID=F0REL8_CELLC|nr:Piwi domain-containing protein [Cellulophaga lytica]ADY31033.1 stem cell self-renewal protein Piwi [Cellulophaga lytica DSM 7489]WQG78055.1 Piwi domain-containing protein [Cellulophaga lytica]
MQEHLKTNILNFKWPNSAPTIYLTLEDIEGSHPIHKSKFSRQIKEVFPDADLSNKDQIFTTFTTEIPDAPSIKLNLVDGRELRIYKQFLKHKLRSYFKSKDYIVVKNFVGDVQVWMPSKKGNTADYNLYYKFSFKIQFAKLTDLPELIVSYDGTSKVLTTSVKDIEDSELIKRCVYGQKTFNYQMDLDTEEKQEFYNAIQFDQAYPIFNLSLARALDIPIEEPIRPINKYQKYVALINNFATNYLFKEDFKVIFPFKTDTFIDVPINRINHIDPQVGLLEFGKDQYGNKKTHLVPKKAMNILNPYRRPNNQNIKIFFICHTSHKDSVLSFYQNLKEGVNTEKNYYKGLEAYVNIKASSSKEHFIEFTNENDPIPEIVEKLESLTFDHDNVLYAAFYLSPFDKFTQNPEDREIYIQIKELFLNEGIVTQVVDYEKMVVNIENQYNFQFSLQNMALAIHAKLGGAPWKLAVTDKKELVIGVGAFTNQGENRRYIASAFSFQNNGLFRKFEYFDQSETDLLAGSICKAIRDFTSVAEADKVVIHFYKEMSYEELKPIIRGMHTLGLKIPLYILNINKTEAEDIIAYDLNWNKKLMPVSGTYIRISENHFLLFNNARYPNSQRYADTDGYPFPIKIKVSSPDEDAFEDADVVLELLTQVYQFSRLYWKSLRQQNVPITIKYPEMVAQIAPHFNNGVPDDAKDALWFL